MRSIKWLYMLNKRLLKKPAYIAILLLICLMTFSLNLFTDNSYLLKISVFSSDDTIPSLFDQHGTDIRFVAYSERDKAIQSLTDGDADAVWLFDGDIDELVHGFVYAGKPVAEVIQREENVFLRLSRERLFSTVYPMISREIYEKFVTEDHPYVTRETLDKFYENAYIDRDIAEVSFADTGTDVNDLSYALGAIRGLLAIAVFVCGGAGLIAFKKDRANGIYDNIPGYRLMLVGAANIFLYCFNAGTVSILALALCGRLTLLSSEIWYMLVLVMSTVAFCLVLGELIGSVRALSTLLPILSLLMAAVCPVFINFKQLMSVGLLCPPFYYLWSFADMRYLLYSAVYILLTALVWFIIRRLKFICHGEENV